MARGIKRSSDFATPPIPPVVYISPPPHRPPFFVIRNLNLLLTHLPHFYDPGPPTPTIAFSSIRSKSQAQFTTPEINRPLKLRQLTPKTSDLSAPNPGGRRFRNPKFRPLASSFPTNLRFAPPAQTIAAPLILTKLSPIDGARNKKVFGLRHPRLFRLLHISAPAPSLAVFVIRNLNLPRTHLPHFYAPGPPTRR